MRSMKAVHDSKYGNFIKIMQKSCRIIRHLLTVFCILGISFFIERSAVVKAISRLTEPRTLMEINSCNLEQNPCRKFA